MQKAQEYRDQTVEELKARLAQTRKEMFDLRNIQKVTRKNDQPHVLRQKKREVARMMTVLNEKQSGSEG